MEECYIVEPLVIQGLSHSVNLGIAFFLKYRLKMNCTEEEVALMASRARLVYGGCHNFISKMLGRVLKATKDQMISMQVWRIPREKIGINMLNERPEEAVGVYAKDDCLIPAGMGKYISVQMNFVIKG